MFPEVGDVCSFLFGTIPLMWIEFDQTIIGIVWVKDIWGSSNIEFPAEACLRS
jgi:hypothetical protein